MEARDNNSVKEIDDIIQRGIIERGRRLEKMKGWQHDSPKTIARGVVYSLLTIAAVSLLLVVLYHPMIGTGNLTSEKSVAQSEPLTPVIVETSQPEESNQAAQKSEKHIAKSGSNEGNLRLAETSKKAGNGSPFYLVLVENELEDFGIYDDTIIEVTDSITLPIDKQLDKDDVRWIKALLKVRDDKIQEGVEELRKLEKDNKKYSVKARKLLHYLDE